MPTYIQGDSLEPLVLTVAVDGEALTFEEDDELLLRYTDPSGDVHEVELEQVQGLPGGVQYQWEPGDLDQVGLYEGQIVLTRTVEATERQRTFPNNGYPITWWVKDAI